MHLQPEICKLPRGVPPICGDRIAGIALAMAPEAAGHGLLLNTTMVSEEC